MQSIQHVQSLSIKYMHTNWKETCSWSVKMEPVVQVIWMFPPVDCWSCESSECDGWFERPTLTNKCSIKYIQNILIRNYAEFNCPTHLPPHTMHLYGNIQSCRGESEQDLSACPTQPHEIVFMKLIKKGINLQRNLSSNHIQTNKNQEIWMVHEQAQMQYRPETRAMMRFANQYQTVIVTRYRNQEKC